MLYQDKKVFTLVYTDECPKSGVPPFNMTFIDRGKVEIGRTYKSDVLWYFFVARISIPKRLDFKPTLEKAGWKDNESVLEIIGNMASISISKSWTL